MFLSLVQNRALWNSHEFYIWKEKEKKKKKKKKKVHHKGFRTSLYHADFHRKEFFIRGLALM